MVHTFNHTAKPRPAQPGDLPDVLRLLKDAKLPLDGVAQHFAGFLVTEDAGRIVAAIGCEEYGQYGLLRSAVVDPGFRGRGFGQLLTEQLLAAARERGVKALYLLTTTAEEYFPRFGFRRITRDQVPVELQQSAEFRGACPESAVAMVLEVRGER